MAISTPYVGGMLLQAATSGTHPKSHSSLVLVKEVTASFSSLGMLVQFDGTDPTLVKPLDAAELGRFAGVLVGKQVNGVFDAAIPAVGEMAVIAVPCCEVKVALGATIAAGALIKPGATDGLVEAWTSTDDLVGLLIEGGDSGDVVSAYIRPAAFAVT